MTHPDNLRRLEGSGPWLHPSSPKVQASRALRRWVILLAVLVVAAVAGHVLPKAIAEAQLIQIKELTL